MDGQFLAKISSSSQEPIEPAGWIFLKLPSSVALCHHRSTKAAWRRRAAANRPFRQDRAASPDEPHRARPAAVLLVRVSKGSVIINAVPAGKIERDHLASRSFRRHVRAVSWESVRSSRHGSAHAEGRHIDPAVLLKATLRCCPCEPDWRRRRVRSSRSSIARSVDERRFRDRRPSGSQLPSPSGR
jgi:hypothetical protein